MHLTDRFGVGGLELGILKIVNGLDDSRVVSSVCSFRPGDPLALRPGVKLFKLNGRKGNDPSLVVDLCRLLRRERPHVVHTHQWGTLLEGAVAARLAGVPRLVHGEHGTLDVRRRNVWAQRVLWRRVDRMLSVSSRLAERMARDIGFPLSRITVIRNGLDLDRFQPREDKAAAKLALGIEPNTLLIGTVGRTVPVKDHATFLRAVGLLQSTGTRCSVVIAGTGPLLEETRQLARSLDLHDVRMLGTRDDVDAVLSAFDIFVLSSLSEGLSNTIQEAMASGLPVVATQVGGADELVVDGQTGILVPPADPGALADALVTLVRDVERRNLFGRAGHARAKSNFGLRRMLHEYEDMYLGLGASKTWIPRH